MTKCNRCSNDFDNFFHGSYWCTYCGKQFMFDENKLKEKHEKEKKHFYPEKEETKKNKK